MLKFLLRHIHFIQSYCNNGAIFSMYWLGPQTKIFPSSWFCLKEALLIRLAIPCGGTHAKQVIHIRGLTVEELQLLYLL